MKPFHFSLFVIGITTNAFAQGQIVFYNLGNESTSPTATSSGLFWISTAGTPVLINQDFNAALYAGTDSSNLSLLNIFLLSNGTAIGDNPFPGYFVDPTATAYTIQGAFSTAFVQVEAWTGNYNSYAAAAAAGAPAAQSAIFVNLVGVPPGTPPPLLGMPAMVLSTIPEPSTFALVGLGGLSTMLFLRRKSGRLI